MKLVRPLWNWEIRFPGLSWAQIGWFHFFSEPLEAIARWQQEHARAHSFLHLPLRSVSNYFCYAIAFRNIKVMHEITFSFWVKKYDGHLQLPIEEKDPLQAIMEADKKNILDAIQGSNKKCMYNFCTIKNMIIYIICKKALIVLVLFCVLSSSKFVFCHLVLFRKVKWPKRFRRYVKPGAV